MIGAVLALSAGVFFMCSSVMVMRVGSWFSPITTMLRGKFAIHRVSHSVALSTCMSFPKSFEILGIRDSMDVSEP